MKTNGMTLLRASKRAGISRGYMRLAAVYRRADRTNPHLDFSFDALKEAHRYESRGGDKPPRTNGYLAGKHWLDINVADAVRDIREGHFAKCEFYEGPTGWFWKRRLAAAPATPLFAYTDTGD